MWVIRVDPGVDDLYAIGLVNVTGEVYIREFGSNAMSVGGLFQLCTTLENYDIRVLGQGELPLVLGQMGKIAKALATGARVVDISDCRLDFVVSSHRPEPQYPYDKNAAH